VSDIAKPGIIRKIPQKPQSLVFNLTENAPKTEKSKKKDRDA
jgi:hypothetical protein